MVTLERIRDYELIRQIVTNARIYRHISDDGAPKAENWVPAQSDAVWYVGVKVDDKYQGLFVFIPQNLVCYELHTCLLPHIWGAAAHEAARKLAEFGWKYMPCRRVITNVPAYNRLALKFAEAAGMTQFGVNEKSFLKNGKLHDQIMLGISKPEEPCH